MTAKPTCPYCHAPVGSLLADCPNPPCVTADNDRDYAYERAMEDDS